jgi:hypothetical protein
MTRWLPSSAPAADALRPVSLDEPADDDYTQPLPVADLPAAVAAWRRGRLVIA